MFVILSMAPKSNDFLENYRLNSRTIAFVFFCCHLYYLDLFSGENLGTKRYLHWLACHVMGASRLYTCQMNDLQQK